MRPREEIRAVLADFDLLHDLTEGGTVSRSVLAADTDLLSSLTLHNGERMLGTRRKWRTRSLLYGSEPPRLPSRSK